MAQFDSLIISTTSISLLFILAIYYNFSITTLAPSFLGSLKFKGKKLDTFIFYVSIKQSEKLIKNQAY